MRLNLKAGDLVEVRSREEILATLDARGALQSLPFMPEMLKYCGKQFRVFKSAHKTCDTISYQGARKMEQTVHLDVRCDGAAHGGCQASCLLFWKEAWLKRVDERSAAPQSSTKPAAAQCTEQTLFDATRAAAASDGTVRYSCQATELNRASEVLPPSDLRQYFYDLRTRNVSIGQLVRAFGFWVFSKMIRIGAYRALIWTYDKVQRSIGGTPYPFKAGACEKTPNDKLNLAAGEMVRVKSQEQILKTVNNRNRNRGLSFDEEMVEFCGKTFPVLKRVERIVNERTGEMMHFANDCIMLDGATCNARFKDKRLFCPRHIYPYWREVWLTRVDGQGREVAAPAAETRSNA